MANVMTNVAHRTRLPMQGEGQRTNPIDAFPQGGGPITIALTKMLNARLSIDLRCQTYAELIAKVLICKAVKGNVQAIREIADRAEGKVSDARHYEWDQPVEIRVVYEDSILKNQNRGIRSAQL
jgi:hypothetical protein